MLKLSTSTTYRVDLLRCDDSVLSTKDEVVPLRAKRDRDALAQQDEGEDIAVLPKLSYKVLTNTTISVPFHDRIGRTGLGLGRIAPQSQTRVSNGIQQGARKGHAGTVLKRG